MGFSATLLKRDFLELSLEIDRDISLEIGTGFGNSPRPTCNCNIPLTVDELGDVIKQLSDYHEKLKTAWKCSLCGCLNQKKYDYCDNCDFPRKEQLS